MLKLCNADPAFVIMTVSEPPDASVKQVAWKWVSGSPSYVEVMEPVTKRSAGPMSEGFPAIKRYGSGRSPQTRVSPSAAACHPFGPPGWETAPRAEGKDRFDRNNSTRCPDVSWYTKPSAATPARSTRALDTSSSPPVERSGARRAAGPVAVKAPVPGL